MPSTEGGGLCVSGRQHEVQKGLRGARHRYDSRQALFKHTDSASTESQAGTGRFQRQRAVASDTVRSLTSSEVASLPLDDRRNRQSEAASGRHHPKNRSSLSGSSQRPLPLEQPSHSRLVEDRCRVHPAWCWWLAAQTKQNAPCSWALATLFHLHLIKSSCQSATKLGQETSYF